MSYFLQSTPLPRAYAASRYAIIRRREFAQLLSRLARAAGGASALALALGVGRARLNEWLAERRREIAPDLVMRLRTYVVDALTGEARRHVLIQLDRALRRGVPRPARLPSKYREQLAQLLREAGCDVPADEDRPERLIVEGWPTSYVRAYDTLDARDPEAAWQLEVLVAFCWEPARMRLRTRASSRSAAIARLLSLRPAPPFTAAERAAHARQNREFAAIVEYRSAMAKRARRAN